MSRTLITQNSTAFTHPQGFVIALPLPPSCGFCRLRRVQVGALKREISKVLSDGFWVRCPVTGKRVQIYRHSIFRAQVRTLERLRDYSDELKQTYIHIKHFAGGRRDGAFAKLVLWELIKPMADAKLHDREACDGKWMITDAGRNFLNGSLRVPRQAAVLLGVRIGYVDEKDVIGVADVRDDFDKVAHVAGVA